MNEKKLADLNKVYKYGIYHLKSNHDDGVYIGCCPSFPSYDIFGNTLVEVIQNAERQINDAVVDDYIHQTNDDDNYKQPLMSTNEEIIASIKEHVETGCGLVFDENEFFIQHVILNNTTISILSCDTIHEKDLYINEYNKAIVKNEVTSFITDNNNKKE